VGSKIEVKLATSSPVHGQGNSVRPDKGPKCQGATPYDLRVLMEAARSTAVTHAALVPPAARVGTEQPRRIPVRRLNSA
jgi:hypothetical protein